MRPPHRLVLLVLLPLLTAATPNPGPLREPIRPLTSVHRLAAQRAAAQATDPAAALDACVAEEMAQNNTPGVAVAVLLDGVEVYARGYGVVRRGSDTPVDADSIFRIGSISKMFTAAAVLQQVERGRVALDDPVRRFVPELHMAGFWSDDHITVRNLLTHTSEIPDRFPDDALSGPTTPEALGDWAASLTDTALNAPAGSFFNYSNPNFALAGLVAERADGRDYHTIMRDDVFAPAGLTRTTLLPADVLAWGDYTWGHNGLSVIPPDAYDNWAAAPAGYVFSTARDLVHWALLLMDGGGAVLAPSSAAVMQAPQVSENYTPTMHYGFGVTTDRYKGLDIRYHGGTVPGWGSMLLWVPASRFAVAVLANTSAPFSASALCAVDAYLSLPDVAPPDLSTDPATWVRYDGRYDLATYLGGHLVADVDADGSHLWVTLSGVGEPHHVDQPYRTEAKQLCLDTFMVDLDDDGVAESDVTFIDRRLGGAPVLWFRGRYKIGPRTARQVAPTEHAMTP